MDRMRSAIALGMLLLGVPGCMENIALIGRPTIEEGQGDLVGEVDRVDLASRRLYLRPQGTDRRVIALSADAHVLDRGREYPVARLKAGDVVAMQMKRDARGEPYADLIRIQQPTRNQNRGESPSSVPPRIQTLAGTVQSVNRRDNSFALDDRPGRLVSVLLSDYVRDSDKDRFRDLRPGDHVRIEGKFTARDRFEMLSFLNDEEY
jgi:hypothetical protein